MDPAGIPLQHSTRQVWKSSCPPILTPSEVTVDLRTQLLKAEMFRPTMADD